MKLKCFLAITVLFLSTIAYSQQTPVTSTVKKSFWSLNFSQGISSTLTTNEKAYLTGENRISSFEISYNFASNTEMFGNYSTTDLSSYQLNTRDESLRNYELSIGAKFNTTNRQFFFSLGVGYYDVINVKEQLGLTFDSPFKSVQGPGLNLGLGTRIKLTDTYGVIIHAKVHASILNGEGYSYTGVNAGFEINNRKKVAGGRSNKKFSSTLLGGSVKINDNKPSASYGVEITYDISEKFSLVANYIHKNSIEEFYEYNTSISQNDYAGGLRFYAGEERLKFFVESLLDLNISREGYEYFSYGNNHIAKSLGIAMGAGMEFDLINDFNGLLKANIYKFDNPKSTTAFFGGLKYNF